MYDADPMVAAEVVEGLIRFLAAKPSPEDAFHHWLNVFHSRTCLRLILWLLESTVNVEWLPLIGKILTDVTTKSSHHHRVYGQALTDPENLNCESCSISSLYLILLQVYRLGNHKVQQLTLKTLSSVRPCCCLPPDVIHENLFERVVEDQVFLDVLEAVFYCAGFISFAPDASCPFCRYNAGLEIERCRRIGVYASSESLSQSCLSMSQADPWRSFDFYVGYILENPERLFSLDVVKHLVRMMENATPQVQCELFARVFYPILTLSFPSPSFAERDTGTDTDAATTVHRESNLPPDRTSIWGKVTQMSWEATTLLVKQRPIWELFIDSNGLELVINFCRSSDWSSVVARVLESMLVVHFQGFATQTVDVAGTFLYTFYFSKML